MLVTLLGLASSCKNDDDSNLGLGVQPPSDDINTIVVDSFTVITTSVREDSLRSDALTNNPIGMYTDPIFGESTAALFTEIALPEIEVNLQPGSIDSMVLTLRYTKSSSIPYGDVNSSQTFKVYQLTEKLDKDAYYTNTDVAYNSSVELGSVTGSFHLEDSVTVNRGNDVVTYAPHLRIKITDPAFIQAFENADVSVFSNQDAFRDFLNGLAIVPTAKTGTGAIIPFDMQSTISNLTVYSDTNIYDFRINETTRRVSHYTHGALPAYITQQFTDKINHDTTYVQSMGRVKTHITFPYLLDVVKEGNVALKGAEIEFFVDPLTVTTEFPAPARLLIAQPDLEGRNAGINPLDLARAPGNYDADRGVYTFSITSHLQEIFIAWLSSNTNNNRGLYLIIPTENPNTTSRVVIDASKTKLKLFYNKVN